MILVRAVSKYSPSLQTHTALRQSKLAEGDTSPASVRSLVMVRTHLGKGSAVAHPGEQPEAPTGDASQRRAHREFVQVLTLFKFDAKVVPILPYRVPYFVFRKLLVLPRTIKL